MRVLRWEEVAGVRAGQVLTSSLVYAGGGFWEELETRGRRRARARAYRPRVGKPRKTFLRKGLVEARGAQGPFGTSPGPARGSFSRKRDPAETEASWASHRGFPRPTPVERLPLERVGSEARQAFYGEALRQDLGKTGVWVEEVREKAKKREGPLAEENRPGGSEEIRAQRPWVKVWGGRLFASGQAEEDREVRQGFAERLWESWTGRLRTLRPRSPGTPPTPEARRGQEKRRLPGLVVGSLWLGENPEGLFASLQGHRLWLVWGHGWGPGSREGLRLFVSAEARGPGGRIGGDAVRAQREAASGVEVTRQLSHERTQQRRRSLAGARRHVVAVRRSPGSDERTYRGVGGRGRKTPAGARPTSVFEEERVVEENRYFLRELVRSLPVHGLEAPLSISPYTDERLADREARGTTNGETAKAVGWRKARREEPGGFAVIHGVRRGRGVSDTEVCLRIRDRVTQVPTDVWVPGERTVGLGPARASEEAPVAIPRGSLGDTALRPGRKVSSGSVRRSPKERRRNWGEGWERGVWRERPWARRPVHPRVWRERGGDGSERTAAVAGRGIRALEREVSRAVMARRRARDRETDRRKGRRRSRWSEGEARVVRKERGLTREVGTRLGKVWSSKQRKREREAWGYSASVDEREARVGAWYGEKRKAEDAERAEEEAGGVRPRSRPTPYRSEGLVVWPCDGVGRRLAWEEGENVWASRGRRGRGEETPSRGASRRACAQRRVVLAVYLVRCRRWVLTDEAGHTFREESRGRGRLGRDRGLREARAWVQVRGGRRWSGPVEGARRRLQERPVGREREERVDVTPRVPREPWVRKDTWEEASSTGGRKRVSTGERVAGARLKAVIQDRERPSGLRRRRTWEEVGVRLGLDARSWKTGWFRRAPGRSWRVRGPPTKPTPSSSSSVEGRPPARASTREGARILRRNPLRRGERSVGRSVRSREGKGSVGVKGVSGRRVGRLSGTEAVSPVQRAARSFPVQRADRDRRPGCPREGGVSVVRRKKRGSGREEDVGERREERRRAVLSSLWGDRLRSHRREDREEGARHSGCLASVARIYLGSGRPGSREEGSEGRASDGVVETEGPEGASARWRRETPEEGSLSSLRWVSTTEGGEVWGRPERGTKVRAGDLREGRLCLSFTARERRVPGRVARGRLALGPAGRKDESGKGRRFRYLGRAKGQGTEGGPLVRGPERLLPREERVILGGKRTAQTGGVCWEERKALGEAERRQRVPRPWARRRMGGSWGGEAPKGSVG